MKEQQNSALQPGLLLPPIISETQKALPGAQQALLHVCGYLIIGEETARAALQSHCSWERTVLQTLTLKHG